MKKIVIFGLGEQAELALWFFDNDSEYEVSAFTVDEEFKNKDSFHALPVVSLEELSYSYPPEEFDAFVAVGYSKINKVREEKYNQLKSMGYNLVSYISSKATVLTDSIGDNCFILEDNTVQPFVKVGDNVTLWSGNHIGHHSVIEDHCFVTSHVVISGGVTVGMNSFLGVNSTFRDHIKIGAYNVIGAGALIMRDTEDEAVYVTERTMPKKIKSSGLKGI